jgi:hypothetical protein
LRAFSDILENHRLNAEDKMHGTLKCALALALLGSVFANNHANSQGLHPALNNPDRFAWDLFIALNHPADLTAARGTPDASKRLGDPGPTVWETWKLARTEVYLPNACKPSAWTNAPSPIANVGPLAVRFAGPQPNPTNFKVFDPPKFSEDIAQVLGTSVNRSNFESANLAMAREFSPAKNMLVVDADEVGNETRMNRATFDFIRDNELFSIDGQEAFLTKNLAVEFPVDAKEIKASWRRFSDDELDPAKNFRDLNKNGTIEDDERGLRLLSRIYHVGIGLVKNESTGMLEPRPFGLAGLHIITKDIPNWFWTTFEHVDNPEANVGSLDRHSPPEKGYPPEVEGTVWLNYRLRGTQVDFVTSTGRPTILGNTQIEGAFQGTSSCITCHARATIGRRLDNISVEGGKPLYPVGTFIPPSGQVARPPTAPSGYRFGGTRLAVFEDIRAQRPFPALPSDHPLNKGRTISVIKGAVGAPNPSLLVAQGTARSEYVQLDFVWSLRRAFRSDPTQCPPTQ